MLQARIFHLSATQGISCRLARVLFLLVVGAGAISGFAAQDPAVSSEAIASAGPDLTRLLRFMAAIKSLLVIGAVAVILWRLKSPISAPRFAAYAGLSAAMAAGLGEIWSIAHAGAGALLLHAGLASSVILLYRDPTLHSQLALAAARRRP